MNKKQTTTLKEDWQLSLTLAKADFKARNEGSYLGILWYLLNPLLMFGLLFFVFSDRLGGNIQNYPLYLLLGIVMFNFFRQATTEATGAIVSKTGLIKSINFPRRALIGAVVLKTFFSHIFEIVILAIFFIRFDISISNIFAYLPIFILLAFFVFGVSLILSSVTVYFLDLGNIWLFVSHLIWLGTPIFYQIGGQDRLLAANLINPLYYYITLARDMVIYSKTPEGWMIAGASVFSILSVTLGLFIFGKLQKKFAEII